MEMAVLGIDLGKTVCSVAGLDGSGAVVFRKRIQRFRLLDFLADLPPCVVAMEACGGAHHIGRFCLEQGHEPRLMSPLYVRPYVRRGGNFATLPWALPKPEGRNIVLTASAEHPNNLYPWLRQQKRGMELRIVPESPGGAIDTEAMIAAVDDRTLLMTCPSVSFAPGFRSDLRRLGEVCRKRDIFFLVDGVQTAGILHHDLSQEPIDGFATSASKGLLGAYGIGFLYLSERWIDRLVPAYLSRPAVYQETEDHSSMGDFDYALQPNSRRFEVGSYNLAGAYAVSASLELLLALGSEAIEARVLGLAGDLRDGLACTTFAPLVTVAEATAMASHIVTVGQLDAGGHDVSTDPRIMALSAHLKGQRITHSIRRGQIRMALRAFNNQQDVAATVAAVAAFPGVCDNPSATQTNLLSEV